jgi:hypothetical protein
MPFKGLACACASFAKMSVTVTALLMRDLSFQCPPGSPQQILWASDITHELPADWMVSTHAL